MNKKVFVVVNFYLNVAGKQLAALRKQLGLKPMKGHHKDKHPNIPDRYCWEAMISPLIVIITELLQA